MFTDVSGILWYVLLLFVCVYKWVMISVATFCFWLCVCLHKLLMICRCQKFLFGKVKDAEIMNRLQMLAAKENLEVDVAALSLIASRADGSLRDAEGTLDQLSLLDNKVSLAIVQELVSWSASPPHMDLRTGFR